MNLIAWISLVGIAVGTTALVVVLSVYNGIGNLTQSLFNAFDPSLSVQPAKGKTFDADTLDLAALSKVEGVNAVSQIAEENAWVTYGQHQAIVQLRGVDSRYPQVTGIDTLLYEGTYVLRDTLVALDPDGVPTDGRVDYLVLGGQVAYNLGLGAHANSPVAVHIPHRGGSLGHTVDEAFNVGHAYPVGCFYLQEDIDDRYVLADIDFVRQLMDYGAGECTSLAISLDPKAPRSAQAQVQQLLGPNFKVLNRFEQQPLYYKIFRQERFGIYLILSLIILISTLSLVASLSLLIIDKRNDIGTLRSMGMNTRQLRRMFFLEGELISSVGVVGGLVIGFVVCLLQQEFGLVSMGSGNYLTSAFPVAMRGVDFLVTFVLVMSLTTLAVGFTVRRARFRNN